MSFHRISTCALAAVLLACGGSEPPATSVTSPAPKHEPTSITVVGSPALSAVVGNSPGTFTIETMDAGGLPVSGTVTLATTGSGSLVPSTVTTNGNGTATVSWLPGTVAGTQQISVAFRGSTIGTLTATALPDTAVTFTGYPARYYMLIQQREALTTMLSKMGLIGTDKYGNKTTISRKNISSTGVVSIQQDTVVADSIGWGGVTVQWHVPTGILTGLWLIDVMPDMRAHAWTMTYSCARDQADNLDSLTPTRTSFRERYTSVYWAATW